MGADEEVEGPEGAAPNTVEPLEFVVLRIDELVLQMQMQINSISTNILISFQKFIDQTGCRGLTLLMGTRTSHCL